MQVRDVGAAAAGGLVVAGALIAPGLVRRAVDDIRRMREDEREQRQAIANLIRDVDGLRKGLDANGEDLTKIIAYCAASIFDLEKPYNKDVATLVVSRLDGVQIMEAHKGLVRDWLREEKARKRAQEEAEHGTRLRCPECETLRPDWAPYLQRQKDVKDAGDPPSCPGCGSTAIPKEPRPRPLATGEAG